MSYIGNPPAEAYTNTVKDSFSGDGSTVAFTLSRPSLTNDVRVVVENVIQDPTVAYSVSGTTLTFTSAPPSGTNNIYVVHLGPAVQTAVPPSEISAATTFASNVTVQGAFTSRGIDDNATSTAMTLDTSRNLLVGKTSTTGGVAGVELRSDGQIVSYRDGNRCLYLDRLTSDGSIIDLLKDGSTVGSIQSRAGLVSTIILDPRTAGAGLTGAGNGATERNIVGTNESGTEVDGEVILGKAGVRFKNLYLSGGVYLGGTGAANYLDDYEEGTWTPTIASGGTVAGSPIGLYNKVGRQVTAWVSLSIGTISGSGTFYIGGLPFTESFGVSSQGAVRNQGINSASYGNVFVAEVQGSTALARFHYMNNSSTQLLVQVADASASDFISFGVTYITNA